MGDFLGGQSARRKTLHNALGIGEKLPSHSVEPVRIPGTEYHVFLRAPSERKYKSDGRAYRRMTHRVVVICTCGALIPAGRMNQHLEGRKHNATQ